MSADAHSRAAEMLGVPVEATAEAAINAFLAKLPVKDFVPEGTSAAALNAIAGLAIPTDADDTSLTLREEVEEFAQQYWSYAPADRLAKWQTLSSRALDDSTNNRLLGLKAGLELLKTPLSDSTGEQIIAIAQEIYVLPAREQAIRRNEWLLANAARHKELIVAAAAIQKNQPAFAALDPILFARLTSQFDARAFAAGAAASLLPERLGGPSDPIVYHPSAPKPAAPSPAAREEESNDSNGKLAWIVGIGLMVLLRVMVGALSHSDSPTPFHSSIEKSYTMTEGPKTRDASGLDSRSVTAPDIKIHFTETQVMECLEYEKSDKAIPMPRHYAAWVKAGRPKAFVRFSAEEITRFQGYARNRVGKAPRGFEDWIEAGQPELSR